jgi:hypothetical protein
VRQTAREQVRVTRTIQYPFEPFSDRVWELRGNLTVYDAWHVALAVYDAWHVALAEWLQTDLVISPLPPGSDYGRMLVEEEITRASRESGGLPEPLSLSPGQESASAVLARLRSNER